MSDALPVMAESRIAPAVFAGVLAAVNSPAAPDAAALYEIPLSWGLDPAVALAFFRHESRCGTQGVAVRTRNWGNLRKGQGNHLRNAEGWAWYATWADGLRDWCTLIATVYVPRGHTTVETIVPVYAPSSDGNVPAAYIAAVRADVARWQAQSAAIADPWAGWGEAAPLAREHAIPRRWAREGNLGAALGPEIYRPDGGASVQWFAHGAILWLGGDRTEVVRG
jgi:hypothetical protein